MSLRAVLVTTASPPALGGIQAVLYNTARQFSRLQVRVIAPAHADAKQFDRDQPFPVRRVAPATASNRVSRALRVLKMAFWVLWDLRREPPAVLLCGHPFTALIGLAAKRLLGVPFVVWTHGKELLAWQFLLRRSLAAADAVLVISEHTRGLVMRLGVKPERIVWIPYAPDCVPAQAEAAPDPDRPVLLTVARLDELYKGHDVMTRALALVAAKFPGVSWVVVGDGKLRGHYERLARGLGVADHVRFVGAASRQERDDWFQRCDVFVMLSRDRAIDGGAEGFGIVFLEAGAFGKPVVAGRAGGSVDAVADGVTGVLVDPENALEVADAISNLLADPARARQMGEQSRTRVRDQFSWTRTAAVIEDVLEQVTHA
jgi:phosphatidylinositol alpha-1,6-mannosyltransferase